jgi:hypothetical protein
MTLTASVPLIIALIFVIVGIVFGIVDKGWRAPLFWFVLAICVIAIIGPAFGT